MGGQWNSSGRTLHQGRVLERCAHSRNSRAKIWQSYGRMSEHAWAALADAPARVDDGRRQLTKALRRSVLSDSVEARPRVLTVGSSAHVRSSKCRSISRHWRGPKCLGVTHIVVSHSSWTQRVVRRSGLLRREMTSSLLTERDKMAPRPDHSVGLAQLNGRTGPWGVTVRATSVGAN
jgi:hypothetical protein